MTRFDYDLEAPPGKRIGVVVLQSEETLEDEFRRLIPDETRLMVTRVPSGLEVTPESLRAMEARLTEAAALFPRGAAFDALGYGCTSATAQIGAARVAALLREGAPAQAVTEPLSALVAACRALGLRRLAILSPYVAAVSWRLREKLQEQGIETPVFGSFEEPEEATVARIAPRSVIAAGAALAAGQAVDALFLSCTNLRTLDAIAPLEQRLGIPVLSSNQALAWRLLGLAGAPPDQDLFACAHMPWSKFLIGRDFRVVN